MRVLRTCLSRLQEDSGPRQELAASRVALEILLAQDEGEIPDRERAHRRRPDRAAGAQPDDVVGLVLRPAAHARQHPSRRQPDARPPLAGGVAHAQRLLRRPPLAGQRHAAIDRRFARAARRRLAGAVGLPWPDAREHDPQLRLVVPGHGPAPVAGLAPVRIAARHASARRAPACRRHRQPVVRAGAGRQLHHLSLALSHGAGAAAGARPAAGR